MLNFNACREYADTTASWQILPNTQAEQEGKLPASRENLYRQGKQASR